MSLGSEQRKAQSHKKAVLILVPLLVIGGGVAGYIGYATATGTGGILRSGSGTSAVASTKVAFSVAITHQSERFANVPWLTEMALKGQYWSASCYAFCHGITYTLDPTVTNEGIDYLQCVVLGVTHADTGYTCTVASGTTNRAQDIAVSTSTTAQAATDTYAGSGSCSSGSVQTTDGFILASPTTSPAVTVTAGTPSGSSVTTTIAVTYTDATAGVSGLTDACLLTGTSGTIYLVAEGTFGPDTLSVGNTLTITWSITIS